MNNHLEDANAGLKVAAAVIMAALAMAILLATCIWQWCA